MTPWLDDGDLQLYHGDAIAMLASLPSGIAQTCVTSPPYWGLRDYGTGTWTGGDAACDHRIDARPFQHGEGRQGNAYGTPPGGNASRTATYADACARCGAQRIDDQLGLEATPSLYVERIVSVFREVRRVLRDDGTLWLNLGDSYAGYWGDKTAKREGRRSSADTNGWTNDFNMNAKPEFHSAFDGSGIKPKDLVGIPWRVAFALQADGWYLRSDIIWSKPNPMPESVTDRPTKAHEYLFLFSKQPRYFYDADAIREPPTDNPGGAAFYARKGQPMPSTADRRKESAGRGDGNGKAGFAYAIPDYAAGRNRRSVWTIPTEPFPEAHFATYPQALVTPCIQAGTSERGGCVECGAPWRRQTDGATYYEGDDGVRARKTNMVGNGHGGSGRGPKDNLGQYIQQTTGWEPSCSCYAASHGNAEALDGPANRPVRPQLVLDPFIGSGTTALVARKHGRRCIGIDLSSEYLAIASKRTRQLSLFGTPEEAT